MTAVRLHFQASLKLNYNPVESSELLALVDKMQESIIDLLLHNEAVPWNNAGPVWISVRQYHKSTWDKHGNLIIPYYGA